MHSPYSSRVTSLDRQTEPILRLDLTRLSFVQKMGFKLPAQAFRR